MENQTPTIEVRKRVWNYKVETLDKMKALRDTLNISMPEVIDLAIENLMVETGLRPDVDISNDPSFITDHYDLRD
jgi:hypothetical protein